MPYKLEYHTIKCPDCGREYQVQTPAYLRKINGKSSMCCASCLGRKQLTINCPSERRSEISKNQWANMSDEEKSKRKQLLSEGTKKRWATLTDSERVKISEKRSIDRKNQLSNFSKEEMQAIGQKISKTKKEKFANMTKEEYESYHQSRIEERERYWNSLSEERRKELIKHLSAASQESFSNMTDEEKQKLSELRSIVKSNWWNSLSDEEREQRIHHLQESGVIWRNNLTEAEKKAIAEKQSLISFERWSDPSFRKKVIDSRKQYWANLPIREKEIKIRNAIIASYGKNKLHKTFEEFFEETNLNLSFYYIPETLTSKDDVVHSWDYGVFSINDNTLIAVVDLDGSYFHADNCDYDGLHSKEEYDEKRGLSVSDGVKIFILHESSLKKDFNNFKKRITENYDEFIINIFKEMRTISFPYLTYTDIELIRSYTNLVKMQVDDKYHQDMSLNTRVGDRLIQHFHRSIWHAHANKKISPYQAWYNDDLLMKCIANRVIYQTRLNSNKILQGFNVSKIAPKVSVFSAGRAKMIINKYLSDYDTIFDPFSGFSGRMLGTISLGKRYIGCDINEVTVSESNQLIKFLKENFGNINVTVSCQNILESYGEYPCLFTCPPYSDKEQWDGTPVDRRACDDWITECLSRFKCKRYVFVVDNTVKYKDFIVDEISNKSHFSNAMEYVVMIDR